MRLGVRVRIARLRRARAVDAELRDPIGPVDILRVRDVRLPNVGAHDLLTRDVAFAAVPRRPGRIAAQAAFLRPFIARFSMHRVRGAAFIRKAHLRTRRCIHGSDAPARRIAWVVQSATSRVVDVAQWSAHLRQSVLERRPLRRSEKCCTAHPHRFVRVVTDREMRIALVQHERTRVAREAVCPGTDDDLVEGGTTCARLRHGSGEGLERRDERARRGVASACAIDVHGEAASFVISCRRRKVSCSWSGTWDCVVATGCESESIVNQRRGVRTKLCGVIERELAPRALKVSWDASRVGSVLRGRRRVKDGQHYFSVKSLCDDARGHEVQKSRYHPIK